MQSHLQDAKVAATATLRHEHEIILRALTLLERLGRRLATGEPVDRPALTWLIGFFRTFADRCHHGKEEQHLFPALEWHGIPRDGGPVGVMLYEHELGRGFVRAMADGDDPAIAEAIDQYSTLLRGHIEKENGVLFPIAERLLDEDEQRVLALAYQGVEEQAAGPGAHERILSELCRLEAASTD